MNIRLFDGPSLLAPFPAVVAELARPEVTALTGRQAEQQLRGFLGHELMERVTLPLRDGAFETIATALVNALHHCHGLPGLEARAERGATGQWRIVMGYLDASAASLALQTGLEVAAGFFNFVGGGWFDRVALTVAIRQAAAAMMTCQPDPLSCALMRVAAHRHIPVYPVSAGSRIWSYGQGSHGVHLLETASHFDSASGAKLARDKWQSNQLITRLGFPGVRHVATRDLATARAFARKTGYPLVVKPATSNKGRGVTVHITTDEELVAAFAAAQGVTGGNILIEKQVAGDDHRLTVFGGRFAWAVRRSPARLVADGEHTVRELVAMENERRAQAHLADIASVPVELDDTTVALLATQGLKPEDRPAAGTSILLGRVANIARGGTIGDCTADVHPDNRELAEAIARSLHLDSAGIDFMTPDIARSWRGVACAVLEVNCPTGFSSDGRADMILQRKFPPPSDGRLPSVVVVGASPRAVERIVEAMHDSDRCVGWTDSRSTYVADQPRFTGAASLASRVMALVLDASCEALVVAITPAELETHGFPLDRCDLAVIAAGTELSAPLTRLIESCATRVVRGSGEEGLDVASQSGIAAMLSARPRKPAIA